MGEARKFFTFHPDGFSSRGPIDWNDKEQIHKRKTKNTFNMCIKQHMQKASDEYSKRGQMFGLATWLREEREEEKPLR